MKLKICSLLGLFAVFGIGLANASDCMDEDCGFDIELSEFEYFEDEDLLSPQLHERILWSAESESTCDYDYNCPFDSAEECDIWYTKPAYSQSVAPRAPHLNPVNMDEILYAINSTDEVCGDEEAMSPLLKRYKMLMRASKSCCTAGIIYKMQINKADENKIYSFLKDDANRYGIGTRCLVMSNDQIQSKYSNGVTGKILGDVRNSCLCKNRKWFESLLEPFRDVYKRAPQFENQPFNYTYLDSMNREITVSINKDVQTVMALLENCPD